MTTLLTLSNPLLGTTGAATANSFDESADGNKTATRDHSARNRGSPSTRARAALLTLGMAASGTAFAEDGPPTAPTSTQTPIVVVHETPASVPLVHIQLSDEERAFFPQGTPTDIYVPDLVVDPTPRADQPLQSGLGLTPEASAARASTEQLFDNGALSTTVGAFTLDTFATRLWPSQSSGLKLTSRGLAGLTGVMVTGHAGYRLTGDISEQEGTLLYDSLMTGTGSLVALQALLPNTPATRPYKTMLALFASLLSAGEVTIASLEGGRSLTDPDYQSPLSFSDAVLPVALLGLMFLLNNGKASSGPLELRKQFADAVAGLRRLAEKFAKFIPGQRVADLTDRELADATPELIDFITGLSRSYHTRADERLTEETVVISPWDTSITAEQRAEHHLFLLAKTYDPKGHPGLFEPTNKLMERQKKGELLTWLLFWKGNPIGTASITMKPNGMAEMCRAAAIPKGEILKDGTGYNGEIAVSGVQFKRMGELLGHAIAGDIVAIETMLRMSSDIVLGTGRKITTGAVTQHVNFGQHPYTEHAGPAPMLLVVPRYLMSPEHSDHYIDGLMEARLYLQPDRVFVSSPLHTPLQNSRDSKAPSVAAIAQVTWPHAFGQNPNFVAEKVDAHVYDSAEKNIKVDTSNAPNYTKITLSGPLKMADIRMAIVDALKESRLVEIIVLNRPENITLQEKLYRLQGVVPLGVFPGGNFDRKTKGPIHVETTFHFAVGRPEVMRALHPIEMAKDYDNSPIKEVAIQIYDYWKSFEGVDNFLEQPA